MALDSLIKYESYNYQELLRFCRYIFEYGFICDNSGNITHEDILERHEKDNNNEIITSIITITEVISISIRENRDYEKAYSLILNLSKTYNYNEDFTRDVGLLHAQIRKNIKDFGLADSFVLMTAKKLNAKILTGDPHFKNFKEVILIWPYGG